MWYICWNDAKVRNNLYKIWHLYLVKCSRTPFFIIVFQSRFHQADQLPEIENICSERFFGPTLVVRRKPLLPVAYQRGLHIELSEGLVDAVIILWTWVFFQSITYDVGRSILFGNSFLSQIIFSGITALGKHTFEKSRIPQVLARRLLSREIIVFLISGSTPYIVGYWCIS